MMLIKELQQLKESYPIVKDYLPLLEKAVDLDRFWHSVGTTITAIELMQSLVETSCEGMTQPQKEEQVYKAAIAGLLHDCAKHTTLEEMRAICETYGILLEDVGAFTPSILHAAIGVFVAQRDYNVFDIEILNAIRYHTTGRENMTLLDKVIYLADSFEPTRCLENAKMNIELSKINIDQVLYEQLEFNIRLIVKQGKFLNLDTVRARNFLIEKR